VKKLGRSKVHRYSAEFRHRVIKSILEDNLSVSDAESRYGVSNQSIYRWLDGSNSQTSVGMSKDKEESDDKLKQRLEALEEELRLERLRSTAYKQMIKEAEEYFNISIEKKSGSKQSKK